MKSVVQIKCVIYRYHHHYYYVVRMPKVAPAALAPCLFLSRSHCSVLAAVLVAAVPVAAVLEAAG